MAIWAVIRAKKKLKAPEMAGVLGFRGDQTKDQGPTTIEGPPLSKYLYQPNKSPHRE